MLVSLGCRISRWVDENRCWSAIPFREFGSPPDVRLPFNPIYFLHNKPCGLIPTTCVSCKQLPLISSSLAFSWSFSAIILIDNSDHRFPHVFQWEWDICWPSWYWSSCFMKQMEKEEEEAKREREKATCSFHKSRNSPWFNSSWLTIESGRMRSTKSKNYRAHRLSWDHTSVRHSDWVINSYLSARYVQQEKKMQQFVGEGRASPDNKMDQRREWIAAKAQHPCKFSALSWSSLFFSITRSKWAITCYGVS